jgi:hypothetical protein
MGYANVDEGAYAMPPPPPVHPMQPQWEPPAGYFDSYFANIQQSMNSQFQQMQSRFNSHFEAYGQQMNDTMHDPMMQRLGDMQTDLQNDLSALNDIFSQISTSEQYQQLHEQQT